MVSEKVDKCLVCGQPGSIIYIGFDNKRNIQVSCNLCGEFTISHHADRLLPMYDNRRKLERHLHETFNEEDRIIISSRAPDQWPGRAITLDSISKMYEDEGSPLEKYESTLRNIAGQAKVFGHKFTTRNDRWLVPTMDDAEARQILDALNDEGYITLHKASGALTENGYPYRLTLSGLRYASELTRKAISNKASVFIAACFSDELKEARDSIFNTVKELGYQPKMVNREFHNELIDLKIYELIRESGFIVADLTCNRPSVYYEVGFAHGLDLQAILTCRVDHLKDAEDDSKRVHFDLNHRNILVWNTHDELAEKLQEHIYQSFGRAKEISN